VIRITDSLFDAITCRIRKLEQECVDSFDQTGFTPGEAWDALPHKAVKDSLQPLYSLIEQTKMRIRHGTTVDIAVSVQKLTRIAQEHFTQVEEFLAGRLSEMSKEQWTNLYPDFHQTMFLPGLNDDLLWQIGEFVKPSEWALQRKKARETTQHDIQD
jgi:hypothetical protein